MVSRIVSAILNSANGRTRPAMQFGALAALGSLAVFGSIGLYAADGERLHSVDQSPPVDQDGKSAIQRGGPEDADTIETMVKRLEAKLETDPDNADGWRVLGWSYYNMARYEDAVDAYGRSAALRPRSAILRALHGEAMVKAAGGVVTTEAGSAFTAALALDAGDVRSRFFTGLAMLQKNDAQGALSAWTELLRVAPGEAEWAVDLRERIVALAIETGTDISDFLLVEKRSSGLHMVQADTAPKGPSAEDVRNAEEMSPEDRMQMVRGMVDRLANRLKQTPDDPDGWIRLIRSRLVLEDHAAARTALSDATVFYEDQPQKRARIQQAAAAMGLEID